MLKLHGFAMSNYYNTARMALLEKGADFEEVVAMPSKKEDYLQRHPMGKVPCLETEHGFLSETSVIIDYIDQTVDGPPLYPSDPWKQAQARELQKEVELYVDLAVRPCFPEAFFGGSVSDEVKETGKAALAKGLAAVARRARFSPHIAGEDFTPADMMAFYGLPLAAAVAGKFWGIDPFEALPGAKEMMAAVAARDSAKAIAESQKR